ncbi:MAG: hypothetical protein INQ03_20115 [Candidatus Heimdallarchaeota archaeon]|nr:hypothetical protein [Candidatus Heimdallarchaeota archaeon]
MSILDKIMKKGIYSNDEYLRKLAIVNIEDQKKLEKIAFKDKHRDVRAAAVKKLVNIPQIEKIAIKDKDRLVRFTAVQMINDQELLAEIVLKDELYVGNEAINKIFNPEVLEHILKESSSLTFKQIASDRLEKIHEDDLGLEQEV